MCIHIIIKYNPPHRKNMNKSCIDKSFIAYYFSYSVFYNMWVYTKMYVHVRMSHDIFCTHTYNGKHVQCMSSLIIISVYTCTCIYLLNVLTFNSASNNIIYYYSVYTVQPVPGKGLL